MPGLQPALEVEPRRVRRIGAREPAGGEAEPRRLGPYCFLKAFAAMHASASTARCASAFRRNFSASPGPAQQTRTIAVEAVDLVKDFGETRAVDGVSLAVPAGSIYGMLGPNGAGKTTTLRMLLGIIDPSSGTRRVLGHERPLDAAPGGRLSARGARPLSGDARARRDRLHGRAARPAAARGPPPRRSAARRARTWRLGEKADPHALQGHGADRPAARHDHSPAAADRPRRAFFRPRRDQPGAARGADPARGADRRDDHLLDPRHRPRRAAVRADRDHRQGQGGVRGQRRRGARPAAADRSPAHPRRRRAVALGDSRQARGARAANVCSSCPRAVPNPCSRR